MAIARRAKADLFISLHAILSKMVQSAAPLFTPYLKMHPIGRQLN